jgi:hypothetical protein
MPPTWDAIPHDVLCPLCDYNLRGLTDPRCPECGYRFEWPNVIDPDKRAHPYLFEHHPERNVRSFIRTLIGTTRSRRFWCSLSPSQPVRPERLMRYWFLTSLLVFIAVAAEWARATAEYYNSGFSRFWYAPTPWEHLRIAAQRAWESNKALSFVLYAAIVWLIWPWVTLPTLMIFGDSMRRARVKREHVVRCLVYSFDVGAWIATVAAIAAMLSIWILPDVLNALTPYRLLLITGVAILLIVCRMWIAYRTYLRFDHPFWTILASQIIVFLLGANVMVMLYWNQLFSYRFWAFWD